MTWQERFDAACAHVAKTFVWPRVHTTDSYLRIRDESHAVNAYATAIYTRMLGKTYLSWDDEVSWAYMSHGYDPASKPYYDVARRAFKEHFHDLPEVKPRSTHMTFGDYGFEDEFYNAVC